MATKTIIQIARRCIICGENIITCNQYDKRKVCDKCRAAIMKIRRDMESESK